MSINVIHGPVALSCQGSDGKRYWYGIASRNRVCAPLRRTAERALKDAAKIEQSLPKAG